MRYHNSRDFEYTASHHQRTRPPTHWSTGHGNVLTGRGNFLTGRGYILIGRGHRRINITASITSATDVTVTTACIAAVIDIVIHTIVAVLYRCHARRGFNRRRRNHVDQTRRHDVGPPRYS